MTAAVPAVAPGPLLRVRGLSVEFGDRRRGARPVRALDGVDLDVPAGRTVGLVGESGSGKSTLSQVVLGLQRAVAGTVHLDGREVPVRGGRYPAGLRRVVQVVFQDPYASLNPSLTVGVLVGEGAALHQGLRGRELADRVVELLDAVGLPADLVTRYPRELSGGQRQRVALARAIAPRPRLIVLDEPVSSVDLATQLQVVALLADLQARFGLAYLFIAHDLALVHRACDRIAVLHRGRLVEEGSADDVWHRPRADHTRALLAAVPRVRPRRATGASPGSSDDRASLSP